MTVTNADSQTLAFAAPSPHEPARPSWSVVAMDEPPASLQRGNEAPRSRLARYPMIVEDPAMVDVVRRAEQIAWSEATVLIEGESGTGKEILAHHIHHRSRRSAGPFVAVNCAAIPEQLLESELFGHERGAFSGAIGRRIGKFEAAHGGTILLDEVSEMDIRLQAKLLRALQEREVDRVGGRSPVKIHVRVIATTNCDLWSEVGRRTFREDLYFRLNVAPLRVPPLRQRPVDISALADYFGRKYAAENMLPPPFLTAEARTRLIGYGWPGNVRELENIIHRAVILAGGQAIDAAALDLPERGRMALALPQLMTPLVALHTASHTSLHGAPGGTAFVARSLEQMEQDLIISTLAHTTGNRTHAAAILGISIRALRNKLRDYSAAGIPVPAPSAHGTG